MGGHHQQGSPTPGATLIAELARQVEQFADTGALRIAALLELGRHALHAREAVGLVDARGLEPVHHRLGGVAQGVVQAPQQGSARRSGHGLQGGRQPRRQPLVGQVFGDLERNRSRLTVAAPGGQARGCPREVLLRQLL